MPTFLTVAGVLYFEKKKKKKNGSHRDYLLFSPLFYYLRTVCIMKYRALQISNSVTLRLRKEKSTAAFQKYKRSSCGEQSLIIQSGRE